MQFLSAEYMRRNKWFLLLVALPVLLSAIYYALIASPEYVSESHFVIKSPSQRPASVTSIASLLQTTSLSGGAAQAGEVIDYITSRSALAMLNAHGAIATFYDRPGADIFSRYPHFGTSPTNEGLYRYYKKMINISLDHDTGVVVLKTNGFTAPDAQAINRRLLVLGEQLVNELNEHARRHEVDEAKVRVAAAEQRVQKSRVALGAYRNSHDILDPSKQAIGVLNIASKLVSEQAAIKAQLQLTERTAPNNPAIPMLQARVSALGAQIATQNGRAVGTSGAISSKMTDYENLSLEEKFSEENLVAASAALETSRVDAIRQQYYLELVVEPDLPDYPELPHGLRSVLTLAGVLLCLYFVGWMFVVGILEHSPED